MTDLIFEKLKKTSKKFPNSPGVYYWRDSKGEPLYIGRAGSLKKRIANYFTSRVDPRIKEMTELAVKLDFETTDTLLEAIVLEANLIKQYWPKYNILEKDGKSFIYMVVTDEEFPRFLMVRGRELTRYAVVIVSRTQRGNPGVEDGMDRHPSGVLGINSVSRDDKRKKKTGTLGVFGPYQSYYLLRKALEIIRKIFPYSNCRPPLYPNSAELGYKPKPCFHYQIGLCPGVCVGTIDAKTYRNNIRNLILFFRGDKRALLKKLQKENPGAILALKQVRDTALLADSDVLLRGNQLTSRRIEGYDISHSGGKQPVGAMVVFENGEPARDQYRLFNIRGRVHEYMNARNIRMDKGDGLPRGVPLAMTAGKNQDDLAMLEEVLERRLRHSEWPLPNIIFVDGGVSQVRRVSAVLKRHGHTFPVVGLSKAGKHAASASGDDRLAIANVKKTGRELIVASRNLFQQVRNEAHRFAIGAQRKRAKNSFLR